MLSINRTLSLIEKIQIDIPDSFEKIKSKFFRKITPLPKDEPGPWDWEDWKIKTTRTDEPFLKLENPSDVEEFRRKAGVLKWVSSEDPLGFWEWEPIKAEIFRLIRKYPKIFNHLPLKEATYAVVDFFEAYAEFKRLSPDELAYERSVWFANIYGVDSLIGEDGIRRRGTDSRASSETLVSSSGEASPSPKLLSLDSHARKALLEEATRECLLEFQALKVQSKEKQFSGRARIQRMVQNLQRCAGPDLLMKISDEWFESSENLKMLAVGEDERLKSIYPIEFRIT